MRTNYCGSGACNWCQVHSIKDGNAFAIVLFFVLHVSFMLWNLVCLLINFVYDILDIQVFSLKFRPTNFMFVDFILFGIYSTIFLNNL